jgi:hypothetical protein
MESRSYSPPVVKDYGTLLELTAALDVNVMGAISNLAMAAVSGPIGGPNTPGAPGGTGGTGNLLGGHVSDGIGNAPAGGNSPGNAGGGGHGGIVGLVFGGKGAGKLPFTGFPVVLIAAFGAAFASTGAAIRSLLRRRRS